MIAALDRLRPRMERDMQRLAPKLGAKPEC